MINNNKGAILLVTIVSMMILTIIGYITLQMASSQAVTDTYNQAKIRTEYAAEGIVERARGYIDYIAVSSAIAHSTTTVEYGDIGFGTNSGAGILYSMVDTVTRPDKRWYLFEDRVDSNYGVGGVNPVPEIFDASMYPDIHAEVWCEFVTGTIKVGIGHNGHDVTARKFILGSSSNNVQTYKIVGVASTNVGAADMGTIVSTVTYYFNTTHTINSGEHITEKSFLGWRKS